MTRTLNLELFPSDRVQDILVNYGKFLACYIINNFDKKLFLNYTVKPLLVTNPDLSAVPFLSVLASAEPSELAVSLPDTKGTVAFNTEITDERNC